MNNELAEVVKTYATRPHKELNNLLIDKSKDQLIALRDARFDFRNYKNCKNIKIIYLNKESLIKHKKNFTKNFYDFLLNL